MISCWRCYPYHSTKTKIIARSSFMRRDAFLQQKCYPNPNTEQITLTVTLILARWPLFQNTNKKNESDSLLYRKMSSTEVIVRRNTPSPFLCCIYSLYRTESINSGHSLTSWLCDRGHISSEGRGTGSRLSGTLLLRRTPEGKRWQPRICLCVYS